jgi:hypothetical protein
MVGESTLPAKLEPNNRAMPHFLLAPQFMIGFTANSLLPVFKPVVSS